jgi:hypothetical protein
LPKSIPVPVPTLPVLKNPWVFPYPCPSLGIREDAVAGTGDGKDEELELGREQAASDEKLDMAEGDSQEEGWEGIADDDVVM